MKKWDKTDSKYWEENLRPPWRPSVGDIKNYKKGIQTLKKPIKNILILGATPELRSLAAVSGAKVWVADRSLRMLKEMGRLMLSKNSVNEKYWVGDWCDFKNPDKVCFDVILGDLVLRLIAPWKRRVFLKKISGLLKPGGLFITRIHFVNEALVKFSPEEIIDSGFSLLDPKIPGRGTYVKNLLISRVLDKNYLLKSAEKIRMKSRADIKRYLAAKPHISSNRKTILRGVLNRLTAKRLATFFPQTKEEIGGNLKLFFEIKDKLTARDYKDTEFFPVYILQSKNKQSQNKTL